jgi:hypothetical protein
MITSRHRVPNHGTHKPHRPACDDNQTSDRGIGRFNDGEIAEAAAKAGTAVKTGKRRGRRSGYAPEACNQVVTLMSAGHSLTASAGVMGVGRTTIHRWMEAHEGFRDAVLRGQAARTFKLETMLLETTSAAVVRFCSLALVNAAPDEWGKKRITRTL